MRGNKQIRLLTAPEVVAVNQDPQCIQASMVHARGATEGWVKPLNLHRRRVPSNLITLCGQHLK